MSRFKSDKKVGEIKHRSGVVVDLMFDPNDNPNSETSLTFWALAGSERFHATSADEVRKAVNKFFDDQAKLNWLPVIEVTPLAPFNSNRISSFVGLNLERYYLANAADGSIRQLRWDDYTEQDSRFPVTLDMHRINHSQTFHGWRGDVKTKLPFHDPTLTNREFPFYLAYDDSTWAALHQIVDGIDRLSEWLNNILGTDQGRARLVEVGEKLAKLLPAPK